MNRAANQVGTLLVVLALTVASSPSTLSANEPSNSKQTTRYFKRIAVAPFLVGHRQPQMDASMDDTLSCPLNQVCSDDPSIAPEAGDTLTRLVLTAMRKRFQNHLIAAEAVSNGYTSIRINSASDTPRSLARQLGKAISADLMVIGVVWRYRHKTPLQGIPENPASVAFAIYLVEVDTGRRLWRGIYNGTQGYATDNIFNLSKQLKMGTRWLSTAELARHGVKEALSSFPGHIKPTTERMN